jgi:Transposase DDE domain group 1
MNQRKAAFLMTECKPEQLEFEGIGRREIVAGFSGGDITSDGGGLLLREVELRIGIIGQFAGCFTDYRDSDSIEHPVEDLLAQRLYGMCLGYEDLNDHDRLRADPAFAVIVGKEDPKGERRREKRDRGKALAGKSTLNRLELTKKEVSPEERYKKIAVNSDAVDRVMVDVFLQAHRRAPREIILDLDATDDLIHGNQEGRFFHGYYGNYCYLPLYIFCGEFLLGARLRSSNIDASDGALDELNRIVAQIRRKWPAVPILIRADSGFCRDEILTWCEGNHVDYVVGLAKNERLIEEIDAELKQAEELFQNTGKPARMFKEFSYRTRHSWSRSRRVIGKAEHLAKGSNPRFIVTSLPKQQLPADIYERIYCARGDMENRIKEQQLGLFADRTSTATMRANQLRLYFSSFAYMLMHALRRLGLKGTDLANAQCATIRLKLLKIGAQIQITVRRIWFRLAGGYPYREIFDVALTNLRRLPLRC